MTRNGRHTLDLTDFIEPAHIIIPGGVSFDLPMDISLKLQARIQKLSVKLQEPDVEEAEYEAMEADLWRLADELISTATPRPDGDARAVIKNLPALFKLISFLTQGYRSLQESSEPLSSPTPTTAPFNSQTSLSQAP